MTTGEPQGEPESLESRSQRLQDELAQVELQRMSTAYRGYLEVDAVSGAVGSLFYSEVKVAGQPVRALIDTGSSATILSFDLFKKIGKVANIPPHSLLPVDMLLRDYSGRLIPIGARVILDISWKGESTSVPVYLRSEAGSGEQCLLGTNAIIPPGAGVEATAAVEGSKAAYSQQEVVMSLVKACRIPGRSMSVLVAQVEGARRDDPNPVVFQPDTELLRQRGLQLEDSLLQPDEDGRVYLSAINPLPDAQKLTACTIIGQSERVYPSTLNTDVSPNEDVKILSISAHNSATLGDEKAAARRREILEAQVKIAEDDRTPEQVESLRECVFEAADVFAVGDERGEVELVEHRIQTGDYPPIKQPSRRVPHALRVEITRMVNDMLESQVIQEYSSPWASPVLLVKKKDGSPRFCVDYRRLNSVTRKDVFSLPRIDDLLDKLGGKAVFSTLDARAGYWQIRMEESSREKTAFITYDGLYEFDAAYTLRPRGFLLCVRR